MLFFILEYSHFPLSPDDMQYLCDFKPPLFSGCGHGEGTEESRCSGCDSSADTEKGAWPRQGEGHCGRHRSPISLDAIFPTLSQEVG